MKQIQDLIRSRPSALVRVPAGTHTTSLVVDRDCRLVARNDATLVAMHEATITVTRKISLEIEGLRLRGGVAAMGGVLNVQAGARLVLRRCLLYGGSAPAHGGGAIFAGEGSIELEDCVIMGNQAKRGGAIMAEGVSQVRLKNCLLADNQAPQGAAIFAHGNAAIEIQQCTLLDLGESLRLHQGRRSPNAILINSLVTGSIDGPLNSDEGSVLSSEGLSLVEDSPLKGCLIKGRQVGAQGLQGLALDALAH